MEGLKVGDEVYSKERKSIGKVIALCYAGKDWVWVEYGEEKAVEYEGNLVKQK